MADIEQLGHLWRETSERSHFKRKMYLCELCGHRIYSDIIPDRDRHVIWWDGNVDWFFTCEEYQIWRVSQA